ncbi:hypothetical protein [Sinorhizobium medicae]|uniref:hypothetical protein n=1 Tax=Sinorhizobium medicae TaxID=110321 RepID=UPI00047FFEC3|nr:hypothetical protein [Sinorhizobium medicae]MDX0695442.1 hypothetical protein [Sinorhizobium medicae]MDX0744964.1 hypothetical protein [Sinorhizobium medicae]
MTESTELNCHPQHYFEALAHLNRHLRHVALTDLSHGDDPTALGAVVLDCCETFVKLVEEFPAEW